RSYGDWSSDVCSSDLLPFPAFAQDATFYSVSYIEVKPSSRTQAIALLKGYREGTHRDDSNIRLELFEQADRPGHFVIVETWRTEIGRASCRERVESSV